MRDLLTTLGRAQSHPESVGLAVLSGAGWTAGNHVRAVAALVAAVSFAVALRGD